MYKIFEYSIVMFIIGMGMFAVLTVADNAIKRQDQICQEGGC